MSISTQDPAAGAIIAKWLDTVALKAWDVGVARAKASADLKSKAGDVDIEEMSDCNAWEMRFVGRLLLACLER